MTHRLEFVTAIGEQEIIIGWMDGCSIIVQVVLYCMIQCRSLLVVL